MITDKIKALFQFIEFLHSNIENFKQYNKVVKELRLLGNEREKVNLKKNFNEKLKYDEIQAEIKDNFKVIQENIISPIKSKATELNVCNFQNEPLFSWYGVESEIRSLKESFSKDDLPVIIQQKNKYIEFRTKTNCTYFQDIFFDDLDEILKELFDYFKETEKNEFEAFEKITIELNSISELAEIISNKSKLKDEMDNYNSITEKLNYWQNTIETNILDPLKKKYGNDYLLNNNAELEQRVILTKRFGLNYKLVSPLLIPEHLYTKHFENGLNEPEFTYWFLKHNARTYFDVDIIQKRFPEKLTTTISEIFIKAELKKLNDFEQKATNDLQESRFDVYKEYSFSEYAREIEYCRIKADYYETRALPYVHAIGNTTVVLYAEHIYLKDFLENELNNLLTPQLITKQKPELTITQIALKYAYEELLITRVNGNEIARQYGYNSGEKLFQKFIHFSSVANRKGKPFPCTPKKLTNKIKLIESIIESLPTDKQERAKDEVSILKKIYEAEYE